MPGNDFSGAGYESAKWAGQYSDMDVVNRERTTADPFAPGAAGDPAKFDTLIYPLDLNPENFFPEAICFQVKKRIGLSIDEAIIKPFRDMAFQYSPLRAKPKASSIRGLTVLNLSLSTLRKKATNEG